MGYKGQSLSPPYPTPPSGPTLPAQRRTPAGYSGDVSQVCTSELPLPGPLVGFQVRVPPVTLGEGRVSGQRRVWLLDVFLLASAQGPRVCAPSPVASDTSLFPGALVTDSVGETDFLDSLWIGTPCVL